MNVTDHIAAGDELHRIGCTAADFAKAQGDDRIALLAVDCFAAATEHYAAVLRLLPEDPSRASSGERGKTGDQTARASGS